MPNTGGPEAVQWHRWRVNQHRTNCHTDSLLPQNHHHWSQKYTIIVVRRNIRVNRALDILIKKSNYCLKKKTLIEPNCFYFLSLLRKNNCHFNICYYIDHFHILMTQITFFRTAIHWYRKNKSDNIYCSHFFL